MFGLSSIYQDLSEVRFHAPNADNCATENLIIIWMLHVILILQFVRICYLDRFYSN